MTNDNDNGTKTEPWRARKGSDTYGAGHPGPRGPDPVRKRPGIHIGSTGLASTT